MTLPLTSFLFPDTVMLSACVVLTLAVVIFVFWIDPDPGDSAPHRSQLDQLLERRDSIYDNLRDLKFEIRAGKARAPGAARLARWRPTAGNRAK